MTADKKELYELGEIPPLGHIPKEMHAWVIRKDREGVPEKAMQIETMPIPKVESNEVLVMVMAAGVNYNGVWASMGKTI